MDAARACRQCYRLQIAAPGLGAAVVTSAIGLAADAAGLAAIGAAIFVLALLLLALFEAFMLR